MTDLCSPFQDTALDEDANRGEAYYLAHILEISERCWEHYGRKRSVKASRDTVRTGRSVIKETLVSGVGASIKR